MYKGKTVTVVMPAYNAEKTLEITYNEIPHHIVDNVILVDDCSSDKTIEVAKSLGINYVIRHEKTKVTVVIRKVAIRKLLRLVLI